MYAPFVFDVGECRGLHVRERAEEPVGPLEGRAGGDRAGSGKQAAGIVRLRTHRHHANKVT